jgi:hypothetical protein
VSEFSPGPGIGYLIRRTPPSPYGIAYLRAYGLSFRWTVLFSLGSGLGDGAYLQNQVMRSGESSLACRNSLQEAHHVGEPK